MTVRAHLPQNRDQLSTARTQHYFTRFSYEPLASNAFRHTARVSSDIASSICFICLSGYGQVAGCSVRQDRHAENLQASHDVWTASHVRRGDSSPKRKSRAGDTVICWNRIAAQGSSVRGVKSLGFCRPVALPPSGARSRPSRDLQNCLPALPGCLARPRLSAEGRLLPWSLAGRLAGFTHVLQQREKARWLCTALPSAQASLSRIEGPYFRPMQLA